MDKLIEALGALVSSGIVALLTWWLTTRARNHQDQEREREALRGQADALIVAVSDLRMAADISREMWTSRNATRLVFLEAGLIALGGAFQAHGSFRIVAFDRRPPGYAGRATLLSTSW
ncbi:hypothetical protein ACF064_36685 [Streptomyces sp. NPDC015492]|uniref:hypothetical protein n=1 Tax=Streptomyces sp. NPDC015492 TaxID=3364958 RepID=UPI0036FD5377